MKTHGVVKWRPAAGREAGFFGVNASPQVITRVKRLFPRASPYRTGWVEVSDTPEVARDLEWLLDRYPMVMDAETSARIAGRAGEHRRTEETVTRILAGKGSRRKGLIESARTPRDYQLVAADLAMQTGRLLLLDALGLGKSGSGLLVLRDEALLPAVVVCYPHLERQWTEEIHEWFPWAVVHAVTQMTPYDPSKRRSLRGQTPDVLIVPWSKMRGWGDWLAGDARTLIMDEVQELRTGAASQKFVACARVADEARCRVGLSATPVYNYGGEIHNVLGAIAPDVLGSRDEFVREWCAGRDDGTNKVRVRDPAALSLYLREQGVMLRRSRRDVGRELPATERIPHVIDTDQDVMDRLSGDVVQLADLILSRAATRQERFEASGELDWRMRRMTGLAKAPYVAEFCDLLLEEEQRIVLYGWHRDVYDQWRARLAHRSPVFYTGTESRNEKHRSFKAFTEGDARVLIVSLRAGAGLDGLQGHCHTAVFGELDWSPGIHEQCIGRLERDGMGDRNVTAFFLISETGSDPVVMETLGLKRSQSEPLIDPDGAPFVVVPDDDRIRRLAQAVKDRHKR